MSRRQIKFLHSKPCASGNWAWHWKPSPRLRSAGWQNRKLGETPTDDPTAAILEAALDLNRQVRECDLGHRLQAAVEAPKRYRFTDLVESYRRSPAFAEQISPVTRREYETRLSALEDWARDGAGRSIFVDQLDREMVQDLKDALLADGGSVYRCAAMLRVLRMVCNWGMPRIIAANPTGRVSIPTPPSRTQKIDWRTCADLAADTAGQGDHVTQLALQVAFWSCQRRADLVKINRFQWRELHGIDPRDLGVMASATGRVMGFRLQQNKTGRWVDCPMPPFLHGPIEEAFARGQWLLPHSKDPAKHISGDVLRRRIRPLLDAHGLPRIQLRDLRRAGMSWLKDMGALRSDVFAISGHPLDGQQKTMADTYMPPDTRSACAAIAAALRTLAELARREAESTAE